MPRAPGSFRLQSQQLFLTYPQFGNDFELEDILQHLREILADHDPSYQIIQYIIAEEKHQDGNRHIHVYLKLDKKCSIARPDYLDLWGVHGNYQGCRSGKAVKEYCTKDNNFISNCYEKKITWAYVLAAENKDDFYERAAKADPRQYIFGKRNLDYYADQRFDIRPEFTPTYSVNSYRVVGEINEWFRKTINKMGGRGQPLIIESPSRFGKTEYFRTVLQASNIDYVYMNSIFNADAFPKDLSSIRYIILDDFTVETFFKFAWKPFWGCQRQFTITDKYKAKRDLVFSLPWSLIWLCNPGQNPLDHNQFLPPDVRPYLEQQNTECITLRRPLFDINES